MDPVLVMEMAKAGTKDFKVHLTGFARNLVKQSDVLCALSAI